MLSAALFLAGFSSLSAIEVTLDGLARVYDGSPQAPVPTSDPAGLPVELTYRDLTNPQPPQSAVVFDNMAATLALSYSSVSFSSNRMCGMGNYLRLSGSAREIESVDVAMVTWAPAADFPILAALNPAGYTHPITLTLYQVTDAGQLIYLKEVTRQVLVPWRPTTLANGSSYPYNGFAFKAQFDFPGGTALPEKVIAMVSYDTANAGFYPIGLPGPYDQLNVALTSAPPAVGSDADPGAFLRIGFQLLTPVGEWSYPNTTLGNKVPIMRVHALTTRSNVPPQGAGNYEVTATISDSIYKTKVLGNLTIAKALATVTTVDSETFYSGSPVTAAVVTSPAGLAVDVRYNDAANPPAAVGTYQIAATVTDPNYTGQAAGTLTISPSVRSWIEDRVASGEIPAGMAGNGDDPDGDGISNLLEYAFNADPANGALTDAAGPLLPHLEADGSGRKFVYRVNLDAGDLDYGIECGAALSPGSWDELVAPQNTLSDDGHTRVVEVALPQTADDCQFYRLRVTQ